MIVDSEVENGRCSDPKLLVEAMSASHLKIVDKSYIIRWRRDLTL